MQKNRAIIVVHLYGRTCWSSQLYDIASRHSLKIIEDNAEAAGAVYLPENDNHDLQKTAKAGISMGVFNRSIFRRAGSLDSAAPS